MSYRKATLFLLFSIFALKSFAYTPKEGNVNAILGPFVSKTNFETSNTGANAPYLGGVGLMAVGDISDHSSLEIAMFHMNKMYIRDEKGRFVSEETQVMHITMGYRRWLTSYLSLSMAFFSAYAMGDPQYVHSDFPKGQEITTSAHDKTEYGLDLALQQELWGRDRIAVVGEVRYSYSLTSKESERADHYGAFLGLRYFVQEKQIQKR